VTLGLIWAQTPTGVIGRDGTMPWHLPEDLVHFREVTDGHAVVMGRATWQSLPVRYRPLPGRENVVLSRQRSFAAPGARVVGSLDEAIAVVPDEDDEVWVIGGGAVYAQAIGRAERLEVTEVDLDAEGDTLAPAIDPADWDEVSTGSWLDSRTGPRYRFRSFTRRG